MPVALAVIFGLLFTAFGSARDAAVILLERKLVGGRKARSDQRRTARYSRPSISGQGDIIVRDESHAVPFPTTDRHAR